MPKLQNVQKINYTPFLRTVRLSDSLPCLLILLAARCSFLEISPFACAMFFSVFDLKIGYMGILFSALGFFSRGVLMQKSDSLLAMLLLMIYALIRSDYKQQRIISSAVCGGAVFLSGIIRFFYMPFSTYDVLLLIIEAITAAFSYILFLNASALTGYLRRAPKESELISAAVCAGIFISGLSGLTPEGSVDISRIISAYMIMSVSLSLPLAVSGSCGVAAGLICSMNDTSAVTLTGLYGLSAIFGNLLKSFGKYGVALGFLGSTAVTALYIGNTVSVSVIEIIAACALFIITPNRVHKSISDYILRTASVGKTCDSDRMREYLGARLGAAGHAFARLASVYRGITEKSIRMYNKDICTVIDKTVNKVCAGCADCGRCIEKNYADSYRIIFGALEALEDKGFCNAANAPKEFTVMCSKSDIFLCELAHSYEDYRRSLLKKGEFEHNRDIMINQYEEISDIFSGIGDEIGTGFCFLGELEEKLGDCLVEAGCPLRKASALENGAGETEIYISLNRPFDKEKLAKLVSECVGMPFECRGGYANLKLVQKTAYRVEYGEKQIAEGSQVVSGDTVSSFYTDRGKFYVLLCDGMGSGSAAGRESRTCGRLLEELIKDGFKAQTAVSLVNSSLALLCDAESFSSVDLLEIDLFTGNADFYKVGCCRSFIKRGDRIDTVFSSALPIGILPDVHISRISKKLDSGDLVIMMSDGADGNGYGFLSGERVKKILSDSDKSMNDVAAAVAESTGFKNAACARDDITVAAIKISAV